MKVVYLIAVYEDLFQLYISGMSQFYEIIFKIEIFAFYYTITFSTLLLYYLINENWIFSLQFIKIFPLKYFMKITFDYA